MYKKCILRQKYQIFMCLLLSQRKGKCFIPIFGACLLLSLSYSPKGLKLCIFFPTTKQFAMKSSLMYINVKLFYFVPEFYHEALSSLNVFRLNTYILRTLHHEPACLAGAKAGCVYLCRVAGNTE